MFTKHAERYVLRSCSEGGYLSINAVNQRIESQPSLDKAWISDWICELNGSGDQPWMKLRRRRDSAA